ncbi:MAG: efflux RND transporter periplasmic adaptor subunit [Chloroflexi bacterium]|nr:efflux RND transporter periplasmic adaptor subunit [Chloroflexota bacterium]
MRRRLIIILVVLLVVGGAGYAVYSNNSRASAAVTPVQTATVTRGNLIATVNSAGPVAARAQLMLNFGAGGTVKQVYVQLGDRVKRGQVLAELDATDLQLSLATAVIALNQQQVKYDQTKAGPTDADIASSRASLDVAQANYDAAVRKAGLNDAQLVIIRASLDKSAISLQKAQSDYDTAVANGKIDLVAVSTALQQAQIDYNSAQANYNLQISAINDTAVRSAASSLLSAKTSLSKLLSTPTAQDLQIAQAQLEQSKINVQQAQYRLRNAQIIAPFDGIVTQVNIDNFITVGGSTQAIQLSDLNKLQVTVNMVEVDIGKVKVGQDVNVTMDALPDRPTLTGKVDQIALVATIQQGVVNYPVVVTLNNPDLSVIKTGMTANVAIVVDKRENVLLVPNRAIRNQGRQRSVQVQSPLGAIPSAITVGLQNDTQSEVMSGLKEGDVVVITTTAARTTAGGLGGFGGGAPVVIPR